MRLPINFKAMALFGGAVALAALAGRSVTEPRVQGWYRTLRKPSFAPPPQVFGPVWTTLYAGMATAAYRLHQAPPSPQRTAALRLWWAQLLLNGLWSPLFFGQKRPRWALADVAILTPVAALGAVTASQVDRMAGWLLFPYVGWCGFATALNAGFVKLNRARL